VKLARACGVEPAEERFLGLFATSQKILGHGQHFLVDGCHALDAQWAGVLDLAAGKGLDHPTRPELLFELGVFRIVSVFRFFLGIEVVEIAEKLVKSMLSGS
jgi:hypothetical protein